VETLKLGWCKIGSDKGAKAIADLLMYNQSLVRDDDALGAQCSSLDARHVPAASHGTGGMSLKSCCAPNCGRWLSISAAMALAMREQRHWRLL